MSDYSPIPFSLAMQKLSNLSHGNAGKLLIMTGVPVATIYPRAMPEIIRSRQPAHGTNSRTSQLEPVSQEKIDCSTAAFNGSTGPEAAIVPYFKITLE
jgi:hypothetical protein